MDERLKKQTDFILETDKMKEISRQTLLADGSRAENDAEHSFHLALMAYLLAEYSEEKIDKAKAMAMVLVHDIIEIDAGDTYAYDAAGNATKRERELKAAERIFRILPEDQARDLRGLWDEFEEGTSAESKFANTLDHLQPVLLTDREGGTSWRNHGVMRSKVEKRNANTGEGSPKLRALVQELIKKNVENGNIKDE